MALRSALKRFAAARKGTGTWQVIACELIGRTALWFIVVLAAQLVVRFMTVPEGVAATVHFLFVIAATLQAAIWLRTLVVDLVERRARAGGAHGTGLGSAVQIIRLLVSVAIFAVAAILVLDNLGVNVTGLIAGLGVGGIAIGLAAQGIFSDLFAALSIIFDRPFRVGDSISYQGKEGPVRGTVQEIGLKSTRIRAETGELRIIGNAKLLEQELTNFAGRTIYRHTLKLGVTYQTPADLADAIPDLMEAEVERAGHRFIRAGFVGFGASSLDYDLEFEVETDDGRDEAQRGLQQVALAIFRTFNDRGIDFAYPTQLNLTAAPDGKPVMPWPEQEAAE